MGLSDVSNGHGRKGQPRWKANCDCDCCPREEVFSSPGGDEGRARKKIQEMGWTLIKKVLRCPKCEAKRKAGNMGQKAIAAAPLRQPTRAQIRDIVSMLDDVYDVSEERYQRGDSDATVADVLGVLPGWVVAERERAFGPDGGNEDIAALAEQCEAFLKDARALIAKRDKDTDPVAASISQIEGIAAQLVKIQRAVGPRVMASAK